MHGLFTNPIETLEVSLLLWLAISGGASHAIAADQNSPSPAKAVIHVENDQDRGNECHGSKVIVAPFDGGALDRELSTDSFHP